MVNLDERDQEVLEVLRDGRANPYLIREETGLDKGDTNTVLNRLARGGYVKQVTRGLYELTADGKSVVTGGQREDPLERSHSTYEQEHWETAHIDRVDNIGAFESPPGSTGLEEVIRVDLDGYGHGGASMHESDENIQVSFWLTPETAQTLNDDLREQLEEYRDE